MNSYIEFLKEAESLNQHVPEYRKPAEMQEPLSNAQTIATIEQAIDETIEPIMSKTRLHQTREGLSSFKKNLITKIAERLGKRTKPTVEIIQVGAVMAFFAANKDIKSGEIFAKAFPDNNSVVNRMYKSLAGHNQDIFDIMEFMSEDEKGTLIMYVMQNYKGVKPETIEKYYLNS